MGNKLFNDDISPSCSLCARCRPAPTENEMLCIEKGVVSADYSCKKFRYDPLKRVPRIIPRQQELNVEDFKL